MRALGLAPTNLMRSTVRVPLPSLSCFAFGSCPSRFSGCSRLVKTKTASADVRKSVCPAMRERNFTRGSVWPRLASKKRGSLPYVSLARTYAAELSVTGADGSATAAVAVRSKETRLKPRTRPDGTRSEEHTSELQSLTNLVCRLLLEKKKKKQNTNKHQTKNENP